MSPRLALLALLATPAVAQTGLEFESPQAHSVAVSADGLRLFALNTPDHRLAIYSLARPLAPILMREIRVGIGPVSIAERSRDEVWVVNHVSDSISVIDIQRGTVTATIDVGDEPGDVVFAGSPRRAFVSLMTSRKVLVIDATTHKTLASIPIPGDDPRSLAVSNDGRSVFVAVHRSGNRTTIVPHDKAPLPPKPTNPTLPLAPKQGLIVPFTDRTWPHGVTLADLDIVELDVQRARATRAFTKIGTILFGVTQRPGSNELWVCNTAALNHVRFEPKLRGHSIDSRLTAIQLGTSNTPTVFDLNPGLDYSRLPNSTALAKAISQPTDIAFDPTGKLGYVASFGTDRVAVIGTNGQITPIEIGTTPGTRVAPREKRGPRSLAHHPTADALYVLNRLSNSLSVVDTRQQKEVTELAMFDPTPRDIREGRGFLYDAKLSGNGTMSCASCHVDGRHDGLAWDLGDPGGELFNNGLQKLHPMKGPLLTQTLQGLAGERIFHWRADRPGLASFNIAFDKLLGGKQLSTSDMTTFAKFMANIRFMPNPNRNRDDTLPTQPTGASAKDGERVFRTKDKVGRNGSNEFRCVDCHFRASGSGAFGFDGLFGQPSKAAQLRGLYKRTGRQPSTARTAGFGFGADGSHDDLISFLSSKARFNPLTANEKAALQRFLFAFPAAQPPIVGFARTVDAKNRTNASVQRDVQLILAQARANKCDAIAYGAVDGQPTAFAYDSSSRHFRPNSRRGSPLTESQLDALLQKPGNVVTIAGTPLGTGSRAIDRDGNGTLDGDEGRSRYGSATPACAPTLTLTANTDPRIGSRGFALVARGGMARASGIVAIGPTRSSFALFDVRILIQPTGPILPLALDARGGGVLPLPLPNDPKLIGSKAYTQALMPAPCGQIRRQASAGLELTVGR